MSVRIRFLVLAGVILLAVTVAATVLARNRLSTLERERARQDLTVAAEAAREIAGEQPQRLVAQSELLGRLTGTDVVLLTAGEPLVSTVAFGSRGAAEQAAAAMEPGRAQRVELAGEAYLARLELLPAEGAEGAGAREGSMRLLLLRRLEGLDPAATGMLWELGLLGVTGLLLGGPVIWLTGSRLHRALTGLSGAMAETARTGRLSHETLEDVGGAWRGSEVEALRSSFSSLMQTVQGSVRDRERSYVEAIGAVVAAIDARDHETTGHSFRVAHYALALARSLAMAPDELRAIEWGSLLHDVGKIAVPDAILRKTGRLTEEEWHVMRQHPSWGFEMLADVKFLEPALEIVYSHHERWDGGGYPRGLEGDEIPLAARIFAVVDTYDSITSDRPYRRARSHGEAITELCRVAGTQLDPNVVEAFIRIPEVELRRLRARSRRLDLTVRIPDAVTEIRAASDAS